MTDQVYFECDPASDLVFKGDFSQTEGKILTIRNTSQHKVLLFKFKMKTTCLQRYTIKPSLGDIAPQSEVSVLINLRPFHFEPDHIYNDKIRLEVCAATELNKDIDNWSKIPKKKIIAKILSCKLVHQEEKIDLECEPCSELVFKGDFTQRQSEILTIRNKSKRNLLFKMKTNSPRRYSVDPIHGEVAQGEEVFIVITLKSLNFQREREYRDKFMLQYCAQTELNKKHSIDNIWAEASEKTIRCKKFKCHLIYQEGNDLGEVLRRPPPEEISERDGAWALTGQPSNSGTSKWKKEAGADPACIVCMEKPQEFILVPCGHAQYCQGCAWQLRSARLGCAVCRDTIERVIKVYR